jgi:hypothetical protein
MASSYSIEKKKIDIKDDSKKDSFQLW